VQVQLLVWIFVMRIVMIIASACLSDQRRDREGALRRRRQHELRDAADDARVAHVVRVRRVHVSRLQADHPDARRWHALVEALDGDHCGTLAGAIIPELVKVFTSTSSRHVKEVVTSSREGGASLNILSGLVAGNFSAYWLAWRSWADAAATT